MRKHASFRAALVAAFPDLERDPQNLGVYIDRGNVAARFDAPGRERGFEWRYTLTAVLLDFVGNPNRLAVAVIDWLKEHEPERLLDHARANEAFGFQVDVLDDQRSDIEITFEISEAVTQGADGEFAYREEPRLATEGAVLGAITIGGEALFGRRP